MTGNISNEGAFASPSFSLATPGGVSTTLTNVPAVTDTGTVSVAISGQTASYTWGANDTFATVQSGLASAINKLDDNTGIPANSPGAAFLTADAVTLAPTQSDPSPAYTVQLKSLGTGYATDWPVSLTVSSSNSAESAFYANATDMAGGTAAYAGASAGGSYTTLVYTPGGGKLATYTNGSLVAAEIPLPGGGTAMYNAAGLNYLRHADWLGSSRLATTWAHAVYSKTAYAPFGETYNTAGSPDASFTGEDADTTGGAYNFLFRKLDPVAGRWLSPDPSGLVHADFTNPQSLNLYAYVTNNPLADFDPNGLDSECAEILPSGAIGDAFVPCYVMDASYNGLPPGENIVPPSFEETIVMNRNGEILFPWDPHYNDQENSRQTIGGESGCVPTQGLQNSATGCGYQFGGSLASIPSWYSEMTGAGQWKLVDLTTDTYKYSSQYAPFAENAPCNSGSGPSFNTAITVCDSPSTSVFQIETDPFFSQQAPQTQYIPTVHCWVTSKPNALTVTVKCKRY